MSSVKHKFLENKWSTDYVVLKGKKNIVTNVSCVSEETYMQSHKTCDTDGPLKQDLEMNKNYKLKNMDDISKNS